MLALTLYLPWPLCIYLLMSILTFILYFTDKDRAGRGKWRIKESTLHGAEFLGGWPGAFVAQRLLRHKNRKGSYQLIFWLIVAVHLAFWVWYLGW
jgi:uncharacterized membrane protein YsdA (DUF1294 family)